MLLTKDEKLEKIEKRLDRLERKVERKFDQMDYSFKIFRDIIIKMESEKHLSEEQRKEIEKLPKKDLQKVPVPFRKEFEELVDDIKKVSKGAVDDR